MTHRNIPLAAICLALAAGLAALAILTVSHPATHHSALAQEDDHDHDHGDDIITTGIVFTIHTDPDGSLNGISIIDGNGIIHPLTIDAETDFGLDDVSGNRWISEDGDDLVEATSRIRDQQVRQQRITVWHTDRGDAHIVVQARPVTLSPNLGYIFAAFAIGLLAIMAYVLYLGQRSRALATEIASLQTQANSDQPADPEATLTATEHPETQTIEDQRANVDASTSANAELQPPASDDQHA